MFIIQENGMILTRQGDNGELGVEGISENHNYRVYFGIRDAKRRPIGEEPYVDSNYASSVVLSIPTALTDLLEVGKDDEYTDYYYGIKVCNPETGSEDTLILDGEDIASENVIRVYPKKVEGLKND